MSVPELSIVIPAYNAASTIARQLRSIAAQTDSPSVEVIVADNRSTDGTAQAAVAASAGLELTVIPAQRAQGANCARNEGSRTAKAPLILFLDADDEIADGALRAVVDAFADDPTLDLATGVPEGNDPDTFELPVSQNFLPYGISAFLAMRREVLDEVGGFDEEFVGGQEEVDFCWRAQMAGFRLGLVRDARFSYVPRDSARAVFRQFRRYGVTYIQLFVKHRDRGIEGSTARAELRSLRGLPRAVWRTLRYSENRWENSQRLGWYLGRWQGQLRYRVWGPR